MAVFSYYYYNYYYSVIWSIFLFLMSCFIPIFLFLFFSSIHSSDELYMYNINLFFLSLSPLLLFIVIDFSSFYTSFSIDQHHQRFTKCDIWHTNTNIYRHRLNSVLIFASHIYDDKAMFQQLNEKQKVERENWI